MCSFEKRKAKKPVIAGDPFVRYDAIEKKFYCYSTAEGHPKINEFFAYESLDMIHWRKRPNIQVHSSTNWADSWFWAPECYYNAKTGWYFLIYSARVKPHLIKEYFGKDAMLECCVLAIAKSRSPLGPFEDLGGLPIDYRPYDPEIVNISEKTRNKNCPDPSEDFSACSKGAFLPEIDGTLFFSETGGITCLFSRNCYQNWRYDGDSGRYLEESDVCGFGLESDWWDDPLALIRPRAKKEYKDFYEKGKDRFDLIISSATPQTWENGNINDYVLSKGKLRNRRWAEGPSAIALDDGSLLVAYSSNYYMGEDYGVGLAHGENLKEKLTKSPSNPIINKKIGLVSAGHGAFLEKDNDIYYFFHARKSAKAKRQLYFAEFDKDVKQYLRIKSINETFEIQ